jgi:acetyl-CoA synthetase
MPGFQVALLGPDDQPQRDGEIGLALDPRPTGLMAGYRDDPGRTTHLMRNGHYHCGDVASMDEEGYVTYVGRTDDVFKSSDYRISPFELESALIEHEAVAEAAVVPSPDPRRLAIPKAFLVLRDGYTPSRELALSIFQHIRKVLAPYKRVRRIEIDDLPKTISGKIRRTELSRLERQRHESATRGTWEFFEEDFEELRA